MQIKQAFRDKSLQCHPDLCPPAQRESAEAAFREIAEAYSSLTKGQSRCAMLLCVPKTASFAVSAIKLIPRALGARQAMTYQRRWPFASQTDVACHAELRLCTMQIACSNQKWSSWSTEMAPPEPHSLLSIPACTQAACTVRGQDFAAL